MRGRHLAVAGFVGVIAVGDANATQADPACRVVSTTNAGVIQSVGVTLDPGKRYRAWTQSTSSEGDPALHWIAQEAQFPYPFLHVTSNDDHGAPWVTCTSVPAPSDMTSADSCMQYKNNGGSAQESVVILHAYRREYSGTTRLIVKRLDDNTTVYDETLIFSGDAKDEYDDDAPVEWDEDDRFDYAFVAEGMLYPDILFLNGSAHLAGWINANIDGTSYGGWWGQPRLRDEQLDEVLPDIAAAFSSDKGLFDTDKPVFHIHFDYGQESLGPFAAGGERLPYQQPFCLYDIRE